VVEITISKLAEKCQKCKHVNQCDEKRMAACAIAELPPLNTASAVMPLTAPLSMPMAREYTPITINMGEYGTINTSLEEIKEKLEKDLFKELSCEFKRR
jgi:hypothetical protein